MPLHSPQPGFPFPQLKVKCSPAFAARLAEAEHAPSTDPKRTPRGPTTPPADRPADSQTKAATLAVSFRGGDRPPHESRSETGAPCVLLGSAASSGRDGALIRLPTLLGAWADGLGHVFCRSGAVGLVCLFLTYARFSILCGFFGRKARTMRFCGEEPLGLFEGVVSPTGRWWPCGVTRQ